MQIPVVFAFRSAGCARSRHETATAYVRNRTSGAPRRPLTPWRCPDRSPGERTGMQTFMTGAQAMNVPISAGIDSTPALGFPAGDFAFRMNDLARPALLLRIPFVITGRQIAMPRAQYFVTRRHR